MRVHEASLAVEDFTRSGLALAPFPNPSRAGSQNLRFSLASAAPAQLELLDISGRQLFAQDVTSFGPGSHSLSLAAEHKFTPGIYLVRVSQGSARSIARMVVLGD